MFIFLYSFVFEKIIQPLKFTESLLGGGVNFDGGGGKILVGRGAIFIFPRLRSFMILLKNEHELLNDKMVCSHGLALNMHVSQNDSSSACALLEI